MKLVKAVIKPFKIDDVRDALAKIGIEGMTVADASGLGRQKGHAEIYRGSEYYLGFLPKTEIEIVAPDHLADQIVRSIIAAAHTGRIGDGKVFVFAVEQSLRIHTGETGEASL